LQKCFAFKTSTFLPSKKALCQQTGDDYHGEAIEAQDGGGEPEDSGREANQRGNTDDGDRNDGSMGGDGDGDGNGSVSGGGGGGGEESVSGWSHPGGGGGDEGDGWKDDSSEGDDIIPSTTVRRKKKRRTTRRRRRRRKRRRLRAHRGTSPQEWT